METDLRQAKAKYAADPTFACLVDFLAHMVTTRGYSVEDTQNAIMLATAKAAEVAQLAKDANAPVSQ